MFDAQPHVQVLLHEVLSKLLLLSLVFGVSLILLNVQNHCKR